MQLVDLVSTDRSGEQYLLDMCQKLELDHATYCTINRVTGDVHGYATVKQEWRDIYGQKGYHLKDPTVHKSAQSLLPTDWSEYQNLEAFHEVGNPATEFGIAKQGLTIPVHGMFGEVGLMNVTRDTSARTWEKLKTKILGELQLHTIQLHDSIMRTDEIKRSITAAPLSDREVEVMQWVAAGKNQQDVADILNLSRRTVETHLSSAKNRLGVTSTAQAVGRAIGIGVIQPA